MDSKKIELKEPIDEIQEKETPKQYYFLDLYYDVDDETLNKFYRSFEGLQKGDIWAYDGVKKRLEFKPFAYPTFRKLGHCMQFKKRRKAHWASIFERRKQTRRKKVSDFMDNFTDDLIESTNDLKSTEEEMGYDDSRPHLKAGGKRDIATARKTNWEILKDLGDIELDNSEQNINLNVDADVKQDISSEVKLQKIEELAERMDKMDYD